MGRLRIVSGMSERKKRLAVEAALLIGFQAESARFPVAGEDGTVEVPDSLEECLRLWNPKLPGKIEVPEGYRAASQSPGQLFDIDFRKERGLENLFSTGEFLKDDNHDFLPDRLDFKIILPKDADVSVVTAACNLAFRFGMETTKITDRITADENYVGNAIVFESGSDKDSGNGCAKECGHNPGIMTEKIGESVLVHIQGAGKALEDFTAELCNQFPWINGFRNLRDVMLDLTDDFILRGADGQLAYLKSLCEKKTQSSIAVYGSPLLSERQKEAFPDVSFFNYKSGRKAYEKTYELPWEVDVFREVLEKNVYSKISPGDHIRVEGALSEDAKVRGMTAEDVKKSLETLGAVAEDIQIFCAYKQGYSWLDEMVIPRAKDRKTDRVEIYFKPFLPEGQTEWLDENGATPSYHNLKADDPDKWYDLPIRYLQELYPIEDRIVETLGISRDDVKFLPYEGDEDITYLCRCYCKEQICTEETYRAWYSERPYMDEYPKLGKVHPATGYIRVWKNGTEILCRRIETDVEAIWNIYQSEVLPDCRKYIEQKTDGQIRADLQPFFHELLLDVTVSEPDYRTGSREDLISSLDALHEDMYFTASDYFKNYGVQNADVMLDAPGLILPRIHNAVGRPIFRVMLSEPLKENPCILCDGEVVFKEHTRDSVSVKLERVVFEPEDRGAGRMSLEIAVKGVADDVLGAYAALLEEGILSRGEDLGGFSSVTFIGENERYRAVLHKANAEGSKARSIKEIDLHEKELISYEMYREMIEELKDVQGIEVFRTAVSYTGRELYAIWLKPEREGYLSMTKRLTMYPSEIINARHHANEVSSTNAAFILLKKLLTEKQYENLPEKLNLVIVPMENVDGAAIHYGLQKEHPYWKLHVARFNALGKEFYHEHFKQDTLHSEAMGLTRLFERYVPDMIVDNHGVPSHEWEQQFSGYTSPSYKGFWLPRSLLYGYFWYVTDSEYESNYALNKRMEDVIADKIAESEEMTCLNKTWSAQFEKYAHAWMPKLFPADYYKNMINYWIPFAANPSHRYPSIRFPWITTVAYTSEVADETAQGDYLNLCARAHVAHDEATIQMLMQSKVVYDCGCECRNGRIFASCERQRPIIAGEKIK